MGISRLAGTPFGLISRLDTSRLRHRAGPHDVRQRNAARRERKHAGFSTAQLATSIPAERSRGHLSTARHSICDMGHRLDSPSHLAGHADVTGGDFDVRPRSQAGAA